jgi:uncharacterized protein
VSQMPVRRSSYLRLVPRENGDYVAYHRLFGNLRILNESSVQLLDHFAEPLSPESYADVYAQHAQPLDQFHDMYYLVEADVDERALHESDLTARRERLSTGAYVGGVQLSISDNCNFACTYCFCDFVDAREEKRRELAARKQKLMSFETARKTIDNLLEVVKRNGRPSLVVKFFGREPLLNWRVMKQVMEHYGHGEDYGVQIAYALTSNGSLVTPEIAESLRRFDVMTTVSVDGLADSNDVARVAKKGGGGTFDQIDRGVHVLAEHGALRALSAVVTDVNFDRIDGRFVDYALSLGIREVQVLLGMQGDFIERMDPSTVAQKLYDIYSYGRSKGVAVTGYWHNAIVEVSSSRRLRGDAETVHGVVESCTATGYQISVEPSGDVFPCRAMSTYYGEVDDLDSLFESDAYKHVVMRTYGNVPSCRDCIAEGFCQGECLGNLEEKCGGIYSVDEAYCKIYRSVYDKVLATI